MHAAARMNDLQINCQQEKTTEHLQSQTRGNTHTHTHTLPEGYGDPGFTVLLGAGQETMSKSR